MFFVKASHFLMESNANVDQIPCNDTWYFLSNLTKEKASFHIIGGFAWGAPEPNFPQFDGLKRQFGEVYCSFH